MSFDEHPRLMVVIASLCVIVTWFAAVRVLAFAGAGQNLVLVVAPLTSIATAVTFLYWGRKILFIRFPTAAIPDIDFINSSEHHMNSDGAGLVLTQAAPNGNFSTTEGQKILTETQPETSFALQMGPGPLHSSAPAAPLNASPETARAAPIDTSSLPERGAISAEVPMSVQKVAEEIEARMDMRCLIITGPSHGVLQDRLNNWLSGKYGRVVSTSMTTDQKGFYLVLFYEPLPR